jgi:CMP-N,N'-diacetyllegionaminic acid synthase
MYKGKKILGLIPARGGSKGLPGKNIRPLLGKPLIAWTIQEAMASLYLDKIVVNTDDDKIAQVAREWGAEVPFMRPIELAGDDTRVIDVVLHALDWFDDKRECYEYMALLEPTSPLRRKRDIDEAIVKLIEREEHADSIISLGKIALEHPEYAKVIDGDGYTKSYGAAGKVLELRQAIPDAYFPYGVIYLSKVKAIREHRAVYAGRIIGHLIERWQNYEINDIWDFICIESILKAKERLA